LEVPAPTALHIYATAQISSVTATRCTMNSACVNMANTTIKMAKLTKM
jgi:hypothetical protein